MCCQSNIPVIVRIKSNLPSAGDVFVFEGVHKNVSNGNSFAQKVCPTPFADRTPPRKKTSRQHTAARLVVSSMMGLIIVSCSYFWLRQGCGDQLCTAHELFAGSCLCAATATSLAALVPSPSHFARIPAASVTLFLCVPNWPQGRMGPPKNKLKFIEIR